MSEVNEVYDTKEQRVNVQSETTEPTPAGRVVSVRGRIIAGLSIMLILVLGAGVLTSIAFSRMNRAIAVVDKEMERANAALDVSKAAADLFAALAQGAVSQDVDEATRTVGAAQQSLLSAEKRLAESVGSLPENDPVRIELFGLGNRVASIRGSADRMIVAAEAGRWWQVEQLVQTTISVHRGLLIESVERMQELTTERRNVAEAEANAIRRMVQGASVPLMLAIMAVALGTAFVTVRSVAQPVERLVEAVGHLAAGHLEERVPLGQVDEFARLATAFNEMAERLQASYVQLEQRAVERERLQQEVIEAQKLAIQELASPVIPMMDTPRGGIIVMPLIGSIDTMRARDITRALLVGIREHRASVVILDITGVPVVDSGVAAHLNKTIQAARLKGARIIVTGISDAVAETIVDLGIDWSGIETLSDLQTGLIVALNSLGVKLSK